MDKKYDTCPFCGIDFVGEEEMFGQDKLWDGHSCWGSEELKSGRQLMAETTERMGFAMLCKCDDLPKVLEGSLENGYGFLPAKWALSLYLSRN